MHGAVQQAARGGRKILALDIDGTLVSSCFGGEKKGDFQFECDECTEVRRVSVRKRPGVDAFLLRVAELFDVYFFTSALLEYAEPIVSQLLPGHPREKILDRLDCTLHRGALAKDLRKVSSDLASVVLLDDNKNFFSFQPRNGILVSSWDGNAADNELLGRVLPLLEKCSRAGDVRAVISSSS